MMVDVKKKIAAEATGKPKKAPPRSILMDLDNLDPPVAPHKSDEADSLGPISVPDHEPDEDREAALLKRTEGEYPNRNGRQSPERASSGGGSGQGGYTRSAPRRRKKTAQDRIDLFISGPRDVMEPFIAYKEHEGFVAYWDVIQDLMEQAGKLEFARQLVATKKVRED